MSPDIAPIAIIVLGAFTAAFVAGVAGFGDAIVASAIWLQFLSPVDTVALCVSAFFVMHVFMLIGMWRQLNVSRVLPFLIAGAIGVPVGAKLLTQVPPEAFKLGAGIFLIVYAGAMFKLLDMPPLRRGGQGLDIAVGWIGGVLGGFAGLSGFVPGFWCQQRGWPKAIARGVTQPYIMAMHGMAFGWLMFDDQVSSATADRLLVALPAIAVGAWIGIRLYRSFNERKFRQTVLAALAGAGVLLVLNPGGQ